MASPNTGREQFPVVSANDDPAPDHEGGQISFFSDEVAPEAAAADWDAGQIRLFSD